MIDRVDMDLRGRLLGIRDQGPRPTCLAHAVTAAHENARAAFTPLSPDYLHFFAAQITPPPSGVSMEQVALALRTQGQVEEAHCPYSLTDPPTGWRPPTGIREYRRASEHKDADIDAVADWILQGQVPVLGISLPESFFTPKAPWVLTSHGSIRGLHAVAAVGVGYHGGTRAILVRNSWGEDWGSRGHVWLEETFLIRHLKEVLLLTDEMNI